MRILLLGEFSSLHKYLKDGLLELGHNVVLASSGDGFKKIGGADIVIPEANGNILKRTKALYLDPMRIRKKLIGYDVVQLINPIIFSKLVNKPLLNYIFKNNGVVSLASAGDDFAYYKAWSDKMFEYSVQDYDKMLVPEYDMSNIRGRQKVEQNIFVVSNSDVIIPSLYEYKVGYKDNPKCKEVIPFPINIDKIRYNDNILVNDRIVFFHGLNRELAKGTPFIREALMRLKENYPNDVEVIIDGHLPFDRYMEIINKANVVVDQCCGYGYGINACISMAQGKIVVSGRHPKELEAFGLKDSPMINAKPDVDYLYNQFLSILDRKHEITEMGFQSRRYVEELHDYKKVAQQYVDAWKSTGKV